MLTINERFARVIKSLGMTTHEAAEALGMTDGYVRKLSSPGQSFGIEPFKAVLAARTNNPSGVMANLKKAVAANPSLGKKAASDLEFAKYFTNSDFMSIVK